MGIFSSIWNKITGHKPQAPAPAPSAQAAPTPAPTPTAAPAASVDVEAVLVDLAASKGGGGNWRTSIVDLLKLLGLDSSLASRKELATELGCPAEKMGDSAQMNMWLHKTVLQQLAANGGNIPASLLG